MTRNDFFRLLMNDLRNKVRDIRSTLSNDHPFSKINSPVSNARIGCIWENGERTDKFKLVIVTKNKTYTLDDFRNDKSLQCYIRHGGFERFIRRLN